METTVLIVSDIQAPYHDRKALDNLISFAKDFKPDVLVNVGDDVDGPEISQWHKGSALEYGSTLQTSFDIITGIHGRFREAVGDVPYHLSRSNHGDRLQKYVKQYSPALASLRSLDLAELAGYSAAGIEYHKAPFSIAPGWVCAHGDEGNMSQIAGRTAGLLSQRWGVSVACGHTHRAGLVPTSLGYGGSITTTLWGLEVGHLMALDQASYLKAGHANWQAAFGLLRINGTRVHPEVIPIQNDGSFCVDGVWYPRPAPRDQWFREAMDRQAGSAVDVDDLDEDETPEPNRALALAANDYPLTKSIMRLAA